MLAICTLILMTIILQPIIFAQVTLANMSHTIYAAKFEQTIIHQHVHLRRESQSHAPVHVLMRLYPIDKSLVFYKSKEDRHVRITSNLFIIWCLILMSIRWLQNHHSLPWICWWPKAFPKYPDNKMLPYDKILHPLLRKFTFDKRVIVA